MTVSGESSIVDFLIAQHDALFEFLPEHEISLRSNVSDIFRKALLLAAGSYFEVRMTESVTNIFLETTRQEALTEFVRNKAVERSYHSWFSWRDQNANNFFGLFGSGFKSFMDRRVKDSPTLAGSIRAFMEIGRLRNRLAHDNWATVALEKTLPEILETYTQALDFVNLFPGILREYLEAQLS